MDRIVATRRLNHRAQVAVPHPVAHRVHTAPLWERACSGRRSDECGLTSGIDVDWHGLFASKPAPTRDLCRTRDLYTLDDLQELSSEARLRSFDLHLARAIHR